MLHKLLKQFGVLKVTIAVTIASILTSILITAALAILVLGYFGIYNVIAAVVVPAVVTPIFAYITLRLTYRLDFAEEKLRQLSMTDELTQAYNRRYFFEIATKLLAGAKRYSDSVAIIIFDIDDFKRINDTYGHIAGDKVLRVLSEACRTQIRESDIFARYGGEEFVILVPHCTPSDIIKFAERIRLTLSDARVHYDQVDIQFTVSIGVGIFNSENPELETVLARADAALYEAKKRGKNCTVLM